MSFFGKTKQRNAATNKRLNECLLLFWFLLLLCLAQFFVFVFFPLNTKRLTKHIKLIQKHETTLHKNRVFYDLKLKRQFFCVFCYERTPTFLCTINKTHKKAVTNQKVSIHKEWFLLKPVFFFGTTKVVSQY